LHGKSSTTIRITKFVGTAIFEKPKSGVFAIGCLGAAGFGRDVFCLLYGAFGDFRQAGLLIALLPMSVFGGMLALNLRGMSFNVSSAVGFIALFWSVYPKRGDYDIAYQHFTKEGDGFERSRCGRRIATVFRPVLMTATVAILGLFPASVSSGIGSDVQRPLATVIVYGLLIGTIITLYALPSLYYMLEKRKLKKEVQS